MLEAGLASVCGRMMAQGEPSRAQVKQQSLILDWVWEFIMLNCNSFDIFGSIANEIPMPDSVRLKKMALLKLISFDFFSSSSSSSSSTSTESSTSAPQERDLVALEGLQDLYAKECSKPDLVPYLRRLLVMAKAEMALVHLRNNKWDDFCEALNKYWSENLVQDTEEAAISDDPELQSMKNTVKSDLWNVKSRPKMQSFVMEEYKRETLMGMAERFLEMAKSELGPSFLELAQQDVVEGRYWPSKRPLVDGQQQQQQQQGTTSKRIRKSLLPSLSEEAANPAELQGEMNRDEVVSAGLRTPEVETALNELKRSQLNLRQHVRDPLPDAIEVAKELKRSNGQSAAGAAQEAKQVDHAALAAATAALNTGGTAPETRKFSIMDRHPSARITRWEDDEIECSPQPGSPSASNRVQLPMVDSGVRQPVSPLPKVQMTKTRRKKNKWTQLEEDTLRKAVDIYGKGRWKIILENNRKVFENRNEVDLKDKWRNIEKAEGMKR